MGNTVGGDMQRILRNTGLKNVSALRNVRAPAKFTRNFRHSARALSVVAKPENASENRTKAMAAAAAAAGLLGLQLGFNQVDNCGIVGYIGSAPDHQPKAVDILMEGLTILQNRGYDSCGVATISDEGKISSTKYASKGSTSDSIQILGREVTKKHAGHMMGIAHTRWATHGGRTDENSHPHMDEKERVALVHNGTTENYAELKKELTDAGYTFKSQTDTEGIVQLIGQGLDQGKNLMDATQDTIARLEGTWGLVIISEDEPDQMIVARNGSPIVVGLGEGCTYIASECSAFINHTKKFVALKDGELAVIKAEGIVMEASVESRTELAQGDKVETSPHPYPHWTIKEIVEQPMAASRAMGYGGRFNPDGTIKLGGMEANEERLLEAKNLLIAACGTSHFAGLYGSRLMRSVGAFNTIQNFDAAEVIPESFPQQKGGLLVISQSGETRDVLKVLDLAEQHGYPMFSIVNAVGSAVARTTGCGVYSHAGREQAVASTKAFVTQVVALSMIAAWFSEHRPVVEGAPDYTARRQALTESLHRLPSYIGMTLQDKSRQQCKESALKIKEITYAHAEGYSGGALKHGPFALIAEGTPIIMLIMDDQHAPHMRTCAEEVRARGAHTIVITDSRKLANGVADDVIVIPRNGPLSALLAVAPLQMIAYEMALAKGINPDKPRNLAKAVTTD